MTDHAIDTISTIDRHYLGAILVRLRAYYELVEAPNIREQVSDEIDWLEERLGVAE